jgi:hypothetical protein
MNPARLPVRTLTRIAQLTNDAACALLYAISISMMLAILASAYTQRLAPAGVAAVAGLVIAMGLWGYGIWRKHRRAALRRRWLLPRRA